MKRICAVILVCILLTALSAAAVGLCPEKEGLRGIMICTLPENGALLCGDQALACGQVLLAGELGALRYLPSGRGEDAFGYLEVYEDGRVGEAVCCALRGVYNRPPQASDSRLRTWRDLTVCGVFNAVDPDADALEYKILRAPAKGRVSCEGGEFVYTPYDNKTGDDAFTYIVRDAYGAWSEEAKVSLEIRRKDAPVDYQDMQGNRAQYAAVRLYEAGIYTGASYGGSACFAPDEALSRGEFIVMALSAAEIEPVVCASTAFDDDETIPVWARGHIAAAAQLGLLRGGYDADGAWVCRADDAISVGEAVRVFHRLCALDAPSDAEAVSVSPDEYGQAQPLSRADAAVLLCRLLDRERGAEPLGLFNWTNAA